MQDNWIGRQRIMPLHTPAPQGNAVDSTLINSDMQQGAAAHSNVQPASPGKIEDYTISVEQVREHFKSKGMNKSKDTVQRWCRTGDLDCQKRGVLGRYFTTETSLLKLEQKLLPDMIAEKTGSGSTASTDLQVHADETSEAVAQVPLHEGAKADVSSGMQQDAAGRAGASSGAHVAALEAQISGLMSQLQQSQEINKFLRDEIVSARGQRSDVVKIAEQMLGTLETMAIGGRLDRPKNVDKEESGLPPLKWSSAMFRKTEEDHGKQATKARGNCHEVTTG